MGEKRNEYRIFVENPKGKRPMGRPNRRWVNDMKVDITDVGRYGIDWIDVVQDMDQ
jgi:hypothetical protein